MKKSPEPALTAFPGTERNFRRSLRSVWLDADSLSRPLPRCDYRECHATCCHDGAFLGDEEAEVILTLLHDEREFFLSKRPELAEFNLRRVGPNEWRTELLPYPHSKETPGYPAHFGNTRCVFLDDEHRCLLQVLSMQKGRHPWHWKPFACWMHPLTILEERERTLMLPSCDHDPQAKKNYPGFASCTGCGAMAEGMPAPPAWETLEEELELIGDMIGRNLLEEVQE